jgi:hypothetical protein
MNSARKLGERAMFMAPIRLVLVAIVFVICMLVAEELLAATLLEI